MIDFTADAQQALVRDTAERFAQERLAPSERAFEAARGLPASLLDEANAIGFDRIDWPEALGGAQMSALARAQMLQQLANGCPGAALALQPMGSVAHALLAFGRNNELEAQASRLAALPGARAWLVFDPHGQLQLQGDRISGNIAWWPADRIDLLAVLTRDSLLLVTDGLVLEALPGSGLRTAGASALQLTAAPVEAHWHDPAAASLALAHARVHLSALMVGQMRAAADYARQYAMQRVAFGKPIAHHQALAFLIADMHSAVETAGLLLHEAAWRLDAGQPATAAAASAFIEAAESALFIGSNAVQILGGAGFMRDYPVEKHLRELRALGLLLGGTDAARDDASADMVTGAETLPPYLATASLEH